MGEQLQLSERYEQMSTGEKLAEFNSFAAFLPEYSSRVTRASETLDALGVVTALNVRRSEDSRRRRKGEVYLRLVPALTDLLKTSTATPSFIDEILLRFETSFSLGVEDRSEDLLEILFGVTQTEEINIFDKNKPENTWDIEKKIYLEIINERDQINMNINAYEQNSDPQDFSDMPDPQLLSLNKWNEEAGFGVEPA